MVDPKIAIIIHAHYLQTLNDLLKCLESLPYKFDLFLNFSFIYNKNQNYISRYKDILKKTVPGNCYFTTSNNRGLDIGGFFASSEVALRKNLSYDLVCKLHTDPNLHSREKLLSTLLGNTSQVKKIFNLFKVYPSIGVVSDKRFYYLDFVRRENEENYSFFTEKLKLKKECCFPQNTNYLQGSMFWMRGDIWDFLMNKEITIKDFELGYAPRSLRAHAFEKVFTAVFCHLGYGSFLF
tara:strand:- start:817 stop:1527 length:711 start_codon:yes stop_codon:yes gene_type:complete